MPHTFTTDQFVSEVVFALPNQEKDVPEYATIDELKERLGIDSSDFDDRLTLALIAAEIKLEEHLGRAFPDLGVFQLRGVWKFVLVAASEDGEVSSAAATSVELQKVDYNGNRFDVELRDLTQLTLDDFVFDIDSVVETSELWTFTGTVASGTLPAENTLTEVAILALADPSSGVLNEIPETVHQKAINLGMLEFKKGDSPLGIAGADAFIGELNVADAIRAELNDRTLLGLKVSWGVA